MQTQRRVVWSEGMLMSPQHLQRQDAFHESTLDRRLRVLSSAPWGVVQLALDTAALSMGDVVVEALDAVLPSGLVVGLDPHAAPLRRSMRAAMAPTQSKRDIYIAVAREREGVPQVAATSASDVDATCETPRARFVSRTRLVTEASASASAPVQVQFAEPQLRIVLGEEMHADLEGIKVAEVVRDAAGALCYAADFVPACLRLQTCPTLLQGVREILELAHAAERALARGLRKNDEAEERPMGWGELQQVLRLTHLRQLTPMLHALTRHEDVSVREAHRTLTGCLGLAAGMGHLDDDWLQQLPPFDPLDLRGAFGPLFARWRAMLSAAAGTHRSLACVAGPDGVLHAAIDAELLRAHATWIMAVHCDAAAKDVAQAWPKVAKAASPSTLPALTRTASPGLPLTPLACAPQRLPWRAHMHYFAIDTQHPLWTSVVEAGAMALQSPASLLGVGVRVEIIACSNTGRVA